MKSSVVFVLGAAGLLIGVSPGRVCGAPFGTAFTYQGRLTDGTGPATGLYDLEFRLFDAPAGPSQIGGTVTLTAVGVTNGVFAVPLDFGIGIFDGTAYWLETAVQTNGVSAFVTLEPRQGVLPTPYAFYAERAGDAVTAAMATSVASDAVDTGAVADFSLTANDIAGGQVVKSINGLSDFVSLLVGPNLTLTPSANTLTLEATTDWRLGGNAGTVSSTDFLGTTDDQDLVFRVNNLETLRLSTAEVAVNAQRGIRLQAYDGPIITRGWDSFSSAAGTLKNGLGRWGLFMEPGQLVAGIPDLDVPGGDRSFSVQKYAANGARTELMRVDNRAGYLMVKGAGGELAYLGGDGAGGDVQVGSMNAGVQNIAFYNAASGTYMHAFVKALTIVGGADLAEPFAMSQPDIAPGSVVVIDPKNPGRLKLSTDAYDRKVAGIVSGAGGINPGLSMIQADQLEAGKNVALSGRVYVRADAAQHPITPGDLLTTSENAGHAMKAADHPRAQGAILGKAMTALESGTGLVLVLVTLQ